MAQCGDRACASAAGENIDALENLNGTNLRVSLAGLTARQIECNRHAAHGQDREGIRQYPENIALHGGRISERGERADACEQQGSTCRDSHSLRYIVIVPQSANHERLQDNRCRQASPDSRACGW